jgi:hypothetical protein
MVAKLRVLSALCALVAAVVVVWQSNPAGPTRIDATDIPMTNVTTSINQNGRSSRPSTRIHSTRAATSRST